MKRKVAKCINVIKKSIYNLKTDNNKNKDLGIPTIITWVVIIYYGIPLIILFIFNFRWVSPIIHLIYLNRI